MYPEMQEPKVKAESWEIEKQSFLEFHDLKGFTAELLCITRLLEKKCIELHLSF